MTPEELWRAVGESLAGQRIRRGWNASDVERHGGPTYKTVQAIERGQVGTADNLARHAEALGLSLADVLYSVLVRTGKSLSPEALFVVRTFEETTVLGRQAFLTLAQALTVGAAGGSAAAPEEPHQPRPAHRDRGPRK